MNGRSVPVTVMAMLGAAILALWGCGKQADVPGGVVARVGSRAIGMNELQRSYSLQPGWRKGQTRLDSYLTQIDQLVIQKIYALEAEAVGMDGDSLMKAYLGFLKEKEMIKGLYRSEVRNRVHVSEAEARTIYEWSKRKIDYEYVFSPDSARCASAAGQLASHGAGTIPGPADSTVRTGRQEGTRVGTLPPDLERALWSAPLHTVCGPIRTAGGFVAFRITGGTQEKFHSENEFAQERMKVESMLADRKADSLSALYVAALMDDKDLKLNPPVFWAVAEHFGRRVKEARVDPMRIQSASVTSDELMLLQTDLDAMGDAAVATHRNGSLTVDELMRALAVMPGSLRPRVRTPENLKAAIGMIVRNQYLLEEARRQGLERDPDVLYEYGLQKDETLASAYFSRCREGVTVTAADVEAYRRRSPVSEEQVFFKLNMVSLARDAKTDSLLRADLPRLRSLYEVTVDTAGLRAKLPSPDATLSEQPMKMFVREVFQ